MAKDGMAKDRMSKQFFFHSSLLLFIFLKRNSAHLANTNICDWVRLISMLLILQIGSCILLFCALS